MKQVQNKSKYTFLEGSCLCGEVKYEIQAQLKQFYFCHCQQCRKLSGSAHASNLLAEPTLVNWLEGKARVQRYDDGNGRAFTHVFCQRCGAGLPFLNVAQTTLFIPAGSLDNAPDVKVSRNIFWAEAADWYESGVGAKKCQGFP